MTRDVMRRLADARPAHLDPDAPVDPSVRAAELDRAMSVAPAAPARRVPRRFAWGLAGAALVAGAAVTAAVLPQDSPARTVPQVTGPAVLLAAADRAEAAPVTGTYWHVKATYARPVQVGKGRNRYWVKAMNLTETWTLPDGRFWAVHRPSGARPLTPADEAAWKRAGSPVKWHLGTADTTAGGPLYLYAAPQARTLVRKNAPASYPICDSEFGYKQVQALPTDPDRLRKQIVRAGKRDDADGPLAPGLGTGFVPGCLVQLLVDVPAPPKVRAAAYRALAGTGGVRVTPGRSGVEVVFGGDRGLPLTRVVIDPKTSLVLSQRVEQTGAAKKVVQKNVETTFHEIGWTDVRPDFPTLP